MSQISASYAEPLITILPEECHASKGGVQHGLDYSVALLQIHQGLIMRERCDGLDGQLLRGLAFLLCGRSCCRQLVVNLSVLLLSLFEARGKSQRKLKRRQLQRGEHTVRTAVGILRVEMVPVVLVRRCGNSSRFRLLLSDQRRCEERFEALEGGR